MTLLHDSTIDQFFMHLLAAEDVMFIPCVCDDKLKVCKRDVLQTAHGNFTKFTV